MKKTVFKVRVEKAEISTSKDSITNCDVYNSDDIVEATQYLGKVLNEAMRDGLQLRQCDATSVRIEKPREHCDDEYVSMVLTIVGDDERTQPISYGFVCSQCNKKNAYAIADFVRKEILVDSGWEEE